MHIGFKRSPPPFLSIASKIHHRIFSGIKGVNFAFGGSGILDSTVSMADPLDFSISLLVFPIFSTASSQWLSIFDLPGRMSTTNQIENFATIRSNMTSHLSEMQANQLLSKSIFIISTGGNDIFDYFLQHNAPNVTEKEKFITTLVSTYKYHLEVKCPFSLKLYNLGARKFGMVDVPPIGCCPFPRSLSPTGGCLDVLNELSLRFNKATFPVTLKIFFRKATFEKAG
ncbi:hypothetical protein IEQ34_007091 [Dendrobium chrysotoxum]|uniref:GDSL esterase/lipase n=1 Tax=Dendrobium chrysotoxum TaxID=161865 RepID=A0AAV7H8D1_DENCH|nr:hypothetical protein IEQ34_007091 [Dendrobium chrysotoxum]